MARSFSSAEGSRSQSKDATNGERTGHLYERSDRTLSSEVAHIDRGKVGLGKGMRRRGKAEVNTSAQGQLATLKAQAMRKEVVQP